MTETFSSNNPSSHLLAQLRLRNYFAAYLNQIISKSFGDDEKYPLFEELLNKQNNFEVVNYLLIITDKYRNKTNLLNELIDIMQGE
ncbi:hypothetical protein FD688_04230 [Apilactobacillus kunkeei]|uniref:hypothetical protein n=1 Tax=Apilactobacillus kunkeei TaxID=148814 RepID=UPI00110C9189|nr:hypothetical protein [Apilactobacillus kunkeei]TMT00386.1 hypothetical protein FD688_04230 [Apilactobacillus kunkeei]